jgi:hypothetical protein
MDYYQGYDDAMRQARVTRSAGLLGFVVRTIVSILYSAFVYVPLLILSYVLAESMSDFYSNDVYIKIGLAIVICYLIFSAIYFLKGILIGLRQNRRASWFVLFALCLILTSGVQAVGAHAILINFFSGRNVANYEVWSWLGAVIVALLIYSHYQFLTNVAPRVVFWSYQLGYVTSNSKGTKSENVKPKKSPRYFDNSPMKVSFRKLD